MSLGTVSIRQNCVGLLLDDLDRISVLFAARLYRTDSEQHDDFAHFDVVLPPAIGCERPPSTDLIVRLQKYVDDLCAEGCLSTAACATLTAAGEDSSYDSDCDCCCDVTTIHTSTAFSTSSTTTNHQDVSRTTSDTLAAEYADYVTNPAVNVSNSNFPSTAEDPSCTPGYTARVEFALKLGYTEKLVRAALLKLGPTPAQNELLAELIKLGAQKTSGGGAGSGGTALSSCDSSPTETEIGCGDGSGGGNVGGMTDVFALRPIVIDGSNVAMSHGNKEIFSCRGLRICVDWFKSRGHREITVFVPKWRKEAPRPDNPIRDQDILAELEKERMLVFTPSRLVGGKRMVCYDDRYILRLAAENDGIVVSNDNYRDLCQENTEFRRVVEERILMYSFVNDRFMPPDDPLGRSGPTLDSFLRVQPRRADPPPPCPYGKKCTYGNKCKYHHPERGSMPHKSVTERLSEHAQRHLQARGEAAEIRKLPLGRTCSNIPPPKEPQHHVTVSKSRSVDNVGGGAGFPPQENFHRKLQRQLTLNPGADPRLVHRFSQPPPSQAPPTYLTNWEVHQHVTRIASAPDSYRGAWPNPARPPHMQRMSSCSDTQLNVWPNVAPPAPPPPWHPQLQLEDARRKLHYHLAAVFPEDQVSHVMHMYPDETNPKKICAAILTLYPKSQ